MKIQHVVNEGKPIEMLKEGRKSERMLHPEPWHTLIG